MVELTRGGGGRVCVRLRRRRGLILARGSAPAAPLCCPAAGLWDPLPAVWVLPGSGTRCLQRVGQGVTLLALIPERGHSPKPRAHSGAEDSEDKLVTPQGLVTGEGEPGPLPTPATLLHPLGKSNLVGLAQKPTCCPGGEWREGEQGGNITTSALMGTSHSMAGARASKPGGACPP